MPRKRETIEITQKSEDKIKGVKGFSAAKLRYLDDPGKRTILERSIEGEVRRTGTSNKKQYSRPVATLYTATVKKPAGKRTKGKQLSRFRMHFRTAKEKKAEAKNTGQNSRTTFATDAMVVRIVDKPPKRGDYDKLPGGMPKGVYFMKDGQILITKPPEGSEVRLEFVQNDGGSLTDYRC